VEQLIVFWRLHLGLATSYIASQMDAPVGAGGAEFMRFLDQMAREGDCRTVPLGSVSHAAY